MTGDEVKIKQLRHAFAAQFSVVGPKAHRCISVNPEEAATWALEMVRFVDQPCDVPGCTDHKWDDKSEMVVHVCPVTAEAFEALQRKLAD